MIGGGMRLPGVLLTTFAFTAALTQNTPQPVPIQGVVLDKASRVAIAGATIYASIINNPASNPTLLNAIADASGRFTINIPGGSTFNLIVSAIGYQQSQQRQPAAGQSDLFVE